jgi:hypothetical protein
MESADVEKAGEVKTQKLLAKLPANYSALTPEEQAKWRSDLAQQILKRARKSRPRPGDEGEVSEGVGPEDG